MAKTIITIEIETDDTAAMKVFAPSEDTDLVREEDMVPENDRTQECCEQVHQGAKSFFDHWDAEELVNSIIEYDGQFPEDWEESDLVNSLGMKITVKYEGQDEPNVVVGK